MKKQYNSFEEVNRELQILDIQRDLEFHRMVKSFDDLKEGFTPYRLLKSSLSSVSSFMGHNNGIPTLLITSLIKFFIRKKWGSK